MDTGIIEINNKKFYKVNITFALNKKDFFFDYFILLGNDKLIQYTNKNNDNYEELLKLQNKSVEYIYLEKDEFYRYLNLELNESIYSKVNINKDINSNIKEFLKNKEFIEDFYLSCGMEELRVKMLMSNYKEAQSIIKRENALSQLLKEYSFKNDTEFVKKELLGLFTTYILSKYDVIKKEELVKVSSAILIEDLMLMHKTKENKDLTEEERFLSHTKDIINYVPKTAFFQSDILINLLKYHHEEPDGSGFPYQIQHFRFDLFLSVRKISERMLDLIIENNLKLNKLDNIIDSINEEFSAYKSENMIKALKLFNFAFNKVDNYE